jgi:hypothetical protein
MHFTRMLPMPAYIFDHQTPVSNCSMRGQNLLLRYLHRCKLVTGAGTRSSKAASRLPRVPPSASV